MKPFTCVAMMMTLVLMGAASSTLLAQTGTSVNGTVHFLTGAVRWHDTCPEHTALIGRVGRLLSDKLYVAANTPAGYDAVPVWDTDQEAKVTGVRCGERDGEPVIQVTVRLFDDTEGYLEVNSMTELSHLLLLKDEQKAAK